MTEHKCPHDGWVDEGQTPCGKYGRLCQMCEQDRADARAGRIVDAIERLANATRRYADV